MIDLTSRHQTYWRRELSKIGWLQTGKYLANAFTKPSPCCPMESFLVSGFFSLHVAQWVVRSPPAAVENNKMTHLHDTHGSIRTRHAQTIQFDGSFQTGYRTHTYHHPTSGPETIRTLHFLPVAFPCSVQLLDTIQLQMQHMMA